MALDSFGTETTAVGPDRSSDIRGIMGAILEDRLHAKGEEPRGRYLVLVSESRSMCQTARPLDDADCVGEAFIKEVGDPELLPGVPVSLQQALLDANRMRVALPTIDLPTVKTVAPAEIDDLLHGQDFWHKFYKRFRRSRGYVEISIPAFSADGAHALTYVQHWCGLLCGTGWLVYLSKTNDEWKIERKKMLWIS